MGVLSALRKYPTIYNTAIRTNHALWHVIEFVLQYGFVPAVLFLGLKACGPNAGFRHYLPVFVPFVSSPKEKLPIPGVDISRYTTPSVYTPPSGVPLPV